jgi:hypothetical protein
MPSSRHSTDRVNPQRRAAARTAAESIQRYMPVLARPEEWTSVAEFVRDGVAAMKPTGPHQAREWMRTLTALTVWAQHEGIPLDRDEILAPDTVQRYCEIGCLELDVQSRATRRSVLRRMGRQLTVTAPWPEVESPLPGRNRHAPYSDREVSRLCALRQATPNLQRRLDAFLALGLGAGLWAREYLTTTGDALTRDGEATLLKVTGTPARTITVRSSFAPALWRMADEHPGEPLVGAPNREWDRARTWHALRYIQTPTDLPLETERLRSTWLVHHLNRNANVVVLLREGGLVTTKALTLLLPHLTEPSPATTRRLMADLD